MTDEAKALVERLRHFDYNVDIATFYDKDPECVSEAADLIETQAREIDRLREACEKVKTSAVATAKIRLVKREREMEVCRSNMSRAKMKCRANEASILLGELRALDVAAIIGDSHD